MSLHGKNKIYLDETRSVEERAKDLLLDMSLEERMAQVNCVFPFDKKAMDFAWISERVPLVSARSVPWKCGAYRPYKARRSG